MITKSTFDLSRLAQIFILSIAILWVVNPIAHASVETDESALIQNTSKDFTRIAKNVIPTVVLSSVEKTIEAGLTV